MMSVIGRKNAGKTTLLVALAAELARRKFRVMTIKHGTHPADTDQRGKDSWRHWHEGHAERVLMEGPGQRVLWEKTEAESDPVALARRYLDGADIVLVEGYKRAALPKIEVYRLAAGAAPLFDPAVHTATDWVAMVTDNPAYRAEFPVFRFSDTAWLVTLANLAWDRAKILPPSDDHVDSDRSRPSDPRAHRAAPGGAPVAARGPRPGARRVRGEPDRPPPLGQFGHGRLRRSRR